MTKKVEKEPKEKAHVHHEGRKDVHHERQHVQEHKTLNLEVGEAKAAYDAVEPEMEGLEPGALWPVRADVTAAASTALRAQKRIESFEAGVRAELPNFPIAHFQKVRQRALAAWYAHVNNRAPSDRADELAQLEDEGTKLRDDLIVAGRAIENLGIFDAGTMNQVDRGNGRRVLAGALTLLANVYTEKREKLRNKTGVTDAQVARAGELGSSLFLRAAEHEADAEGTTVSAERKQRAWTVFASSYDQVRRAISYLRWNEGDMEEIAPSLFAVPGAGRKSAAAEHSGAPSGESAAASAEGRTSGVVNAAPGTAASTEGTAATGTGGRGGPPFTK